MARKNSHVRTAGDFTAILQIHVNAISEMFF